MAKRVRRYPQFVLDDMALQQAHPFQKVALQALYGHGWQCSGIHTSPRGNRIVVMRHTKDSSVGVGVYPDGAFARSKTATVKWDWSRVDLAAKAEKPDPYVANILAGNEAGKTV